MHPKSAEPPEIWNKILDIPLRKKDCKDDLRPPESKWKELFDKSHKRYASHWLWKANDLWEDLHGKDSLLCSYSPSDQQILYFTWERLHRYAGQYAEAIAYSRKQDARDLAAVIARTSNEFGIHRRASDGKAKLMIDQRQQALDLKRRSNHKDCERFKTILNKKNAQARILVAGLTLHECNVHYRSEALYSVIGWLKGCYTGSHPEQRVFWLHGERGCGKSVIAHYLAKKFKDQGALAAGYVFQDGFNQSNWAELTSTFASDFIEYFGIAFKASLVEKAENLTGDMDSFFALPPPAQFEDLLTGAWKEVAAELQRPMLMVLDNFDRCDEWTTRHICTLIRESISEGAGWPIYWVVSSCDNPQIRRDMTTMSGLAEHVVIHRLPLYNPDHAPNEPNSDEAPDTPMPHQSFNTKTPTAATFKSSEDCQAAPLVPLVSATGALYGHDAALQRTDSEYSDVSTPSIVESDDE